MKVKSFKIFFVLLFTSTVLLGQVEYLVKVNPSTCSFSIIDSLPGVKWIAVSSATFDKINNRYVFNGIDANNLHHLYSIDVTNGNIVSSPQFNSNFGAIKFDNSTGILYGVHWTTSLANAEFVSINPVSLTYTVIKPISLTGLLSSEPTFDDINHRFIFVAGDSNGTNCLFSIDVATGNILSKPPIGNIPGLQFDNSSGNLYGLRLDNTIQKIIFILVNPATAAWSSIDTIADNGGVTMGYPTFDEVNKRYSFSANDNTGVRYLYTVDATNGQMVSSPLFVSLPSPYNLIETRYDNSNGNLYALHWGPLKLTGIENHEEQTIQIYPNPSNGIFTIQSPAIISAVEIMNVLGEKVYAEIASTSSISIDISRQPIGVYSLHIKTPDGVVIKKIVKE